MWCLAAISFSGADAHIGRCYPPAQQRGWRRSSALSHRLAARLCILPTASTVWNSFALSYILSTCFSYSTFPQAHSTDDVLVQYIGITQLVSSLGPNSAHLAQSEPAPSLVTGLLFEKQSHWKTSHLEQQDTTCGSLFFGIIILRDHYPAGSLFFKASNYCQSPQNLWTRFSKNICVPVNSVGSILIINLCK